MRYNGSFMINFDGAVKSGDISLQKDIVLDEIADIIDLQPLLIENALRESGVSVRSNASKKELIDLTASQIYDNFVFRKYVGGIIAHKGKSNVGEFSNADGDKVKGMWESVKGWFSKTPDSSGAAASGLAKSATGGKTPQVVAGADPISAIAGAIGSIFSFAASSQDKKAREAEAKAKLYEKVFSGDERKTNWIPVVIIAGVLVIGGIVAFAALRKK